jgi:hypothetical protein
MTGKEEAPKNDSGAILMYIRRDAPVREQVGHASLQHTRESLMSTSCEAATCKFIRKIETTC